MTGLDHIAIEGLVIDCVVGVYPHERDRPQPLVVDVELGLHTEAAARSGHLRATVDYAAVAAQVTFLLENGQFRLLETTADALCRYLLTIPGEDDRALIEEVTVRLSKPAALRGACRASLKVTRERGWAVPGKDSRPARQEQRPYGTVDIVCETGEVGIYRINVAPGSEVPLHLHRRTQEVELVLDEGLLCQRQPIAAGAVLRWPLGAAHGYHNPTTRVRSILRIDAPRHEPEDEVQVKFRASVGDE